MPNLKETLQTYNVKKEAFEAKSAAKRQEIATLMADVEALPDELIGQSEEYISRKKQQLMKRIERKTQSLNKWIDEQSKKIEDWLTVQKQKVQDGIDKMMDLEKQTLEAIATLQAQATAAILTGVKVEINTPEEQDSEQPKTIPPIPQPMNDDEWQYSYINDLGKEIKCTGERAAKRKAYSVTKVYTDPDEIINKYKIKRVKK